MYKLIDAHCDTASELLDKNETLEKNSCMINTSYMKNYDGYVQFFAAYVNKKYENSFLRAVEILDKARQEIQKNDIKLIKKYSDLEDVIKQKKHGAVLAIEDARALCGSVASVRFFYDYGVRAITLAWNDDNDVIHGANSPKDRGILPFGRKVIKEMNRLGMIIDVSHTTERGFYDVIEESSSPVMASHSNCYSLCSHRRNLTDEQIKTLIKNDGIMCINIYPPFLENNPDDADAKSVISHIEHVLSLGGEDHLGLGSDFDGIDSVPKDIKNLKDYTKIFEKMVKIGYNIELVNKIAYKNIMNFMKKVEKGN